MSNKLSVFMQFLFLFFFVYNVVRFPCQQTSVTLHWCPVTMSVCAEFSNAKLERQSREPFAKPLEIIRIFLACCLTTLLSRSPIILESDFASKYSNGQLFAFLAPQAAKKKPLVATRTGICTPGR